jgi:MFS family permease
LHESGGLPVRSLVVSRPPDTGSGSAPELLGGPPGRGFATDTSSLRQSLRAFSHRDFKIFWWGALLSNAGQWLQNLAIPFVLYEITDSATWVGLSTFAQFVPVMLVGPLGGSLADRLDRKRILLVCQAALAVLALALWATWAVGWRSPSLILVITAATGVVGGLNIPSWQALVPGLVPREDLHSAITLNSLQFNAARAIGPAVAGVLLATLGISWAFLLNALSFGFVIAAVLVIHADTRPSWHPAEGSVRSQFREAVRYIRTQPGIEISIVVAVLVGGLGNPIIQMTVVFAEDVFHVGAVGFGLLSAALGIGAIISAPLVSGSRATSKAGVTAVSMPIYALAIVAFGVSPHYLLAVLALVVAGGGFLAVISTTNTAVQAITADRMRGRVMAARVMSFTAAYPVGGLLQGWLADVWGPRPTVISAGVVLFGAGLILRTRRSLLDHLDDPPDAS